MSRTYRRRGERHDYDRVLRDFRWVNGVLVPFWIDPRSTEAVRNDRQRAAGRGPSWRSCT